MTVESCPTSGLLDRFADLRQSSKALRIFSNLEVQQRGMIMISS